MQNHSPVKSAHSLQTKENMRSHSRSIIASKDNADLTDVGLAKNPSAQKLTRNKAGALKKNHTTTEDMVAASIAKKIVEYEEDLKMGVEPGNRVPS